MKCKIFWGVGELQETINKWLGNHGDIKIHSIKQSGDYNHHIVITIWYE